MRILITGGCGFLGSHLCEKYVNEGHTVVALDNFMNGNLNNVRGLLANKKFKLTSGDVRNFDLLEKIASNLDVIIHLAAQIHVDRSIVEPKLTYEINVLGTLNVLEIARKYDINKIIHASSSEVYGSAQYIPINEKHPLDAPHPYGASKIAADRMCFAYNRTYGINVNIVRCFNVYGPKQKETGYGGAISIFAKRVLADLPPILYGTGKQTRDYMYINDAVMAFDLVFKAKTDIGGEVINFGTGKEISINDLANLIIRMYGKEGRLMPVHVAQRPGEISRLCADITKANKLLGFKPKYNIEMGLKEFIGWFKNYRSEEWEKPG